MNIEDYQHFVCIVAGENPEEIIKTYKKGKVEPYVLYPFAAAPKIHQDYLDAYKTFIECNTLSEKERELIAAEYDLMKDDDDVTFFERLTEEYDHDPETGDAICDENPNGQYSFAEIGKYYSIPFRLKDGTDSQQALKKDIDWSIMHLGNTKSYEVAWDTVMEGARPQNEYEQNIYNNMKEHGAYLEKFGDKKTYIVSCTAFWGYAFASSDEGWKELPDNVGQYEWVSEFYERFIAPLSDDTLLTIYECVK